MSTDLLGPASSPNAVTARPAETRTFGGLDTFFKDCTSAGANDGTIVPAAWLNMMQAQLRRAIRGMGVTENNADDDMLLKAIQAIGNNFVTFVMAHNLPIYPHVFGPSGQLNVVPAAASVIVATGQTFQHRGAFTISSDNYTLAQRTFATVANKTYHLRWRWNAGSPAFLLLDLADASYNPGALSEADASFDTAFDDVLVARVLTNGANVPNVTLLSNMSQLKATLVQDNSAGVYVFDAPSKAWAADYAVTVNWARSPMHRSMSASLYMAAGSTTNAYVQGGSNKLFNVVSNRYISSFSVLSDWFEGEVGVGSFQSLGLIGLAA